MNIAPITFPAPLVRAVLDGLSLSLDEHFRWSGSINLAEEI